MGRPWGRGGRTGLVGGRRGPDRERVRRRRRGTARPNLLRQVKCLAGGFRSELASEVRLQPVERCQRLAAVPRVVEQGHQAARRGLIRWFELQEPALRAHGSRDVAGGLPLEGESRRRGHRQTLETLALVVEPPPEVVRVANVEAREVFATVEREPLGEPPRRRVEGEQAGVALDCAGIEGHLVVATGTQCVGAEMLANHVQRVPERGAGLARIELGPEHAEEGVASVPGARCWGGKVCQQRQAFRLAQEGVRLSSVPGGQPDRAEGAEGVHGGES